MRNLIATILVMAAVAPAAFAQFSESSIRSSESIYRSPAAGRGSISGYPEELVVVRDRLDNIVCLGYVWTLELGYGPTNFVVDAIHNSGGRTTLRCNYSAFEYSEIAGGTVELWTHWNGSWYLVDRDRVF